MKTLTEAIQYFLGQIQPERPKLLSTEVGETTINGIGLGQHKHTYRIDEKGNGRTMSIIYIENIDGHTQMYHDHEIVGTIIGPAADGHIHSISNHTL